MICSMTGTVGDYDNDGDLDVFISNSHVEGSKLMRNEGNELFSEVASEMGVNLHQLGWGGLWIDYDNDTWQDLFMSLTFNGLIPFFGNKLYRNNEGASFTDVSSEMGILDEITESHVSIMADFDHDGYYDFFLNNKLGYTPKLYRNNGGSNNHLSVTLQGVESNMQGIGSWVTCYAGGHAYVRFKLCGENLIGQNGDRLVFGLADHQVVDSLVVNWNRGIRDVIYNVPANQHVHVIEGHSHLYHLAVQTEGTAQLCPGEALTLTVGNFDAYLWSDGSTEPTLTVGTTGTYSVEVTTEAGIVVSALPIEVVVANWPQYAVEVSHERCAGLNDGEAHITLYDDGAAGATWSDGSTDLQRDDLAPGMHTFVLSFGQGCTMGSEIEVLAAQPIIPMVSTSNVSCSEGADGLAIAVVFGGQPPYELDWSGGDPQALIAGQHQLIVTDALGCLMVHSFSITEPSAIEIALSVTHCIDDEIGSAILELTGGTPPYSIDWSNENGNGFLPFGLPAGWYTVHVTDSNNCTASETFEVEQLTSVDEPMFNTCRVYPNPVADRLNVAGCTIRPEAEIRITDMRGQTVLVTNEPRPDVSFLAPGVYTLSIVDARASLVARAAIRFVKAP